MGRSLPLESADGALAWHRNILDERERNLQAGSDEVLDWEEAKRAIRERIA